MVGLPIIDKVTGHHVPVGGTICYRDGRWWKLLGVDEETRYAFVASYDGGTPPTVQHVLFKVTRLYKGYLGQRVGVMPRPEE